METVVVLVRLGLYILCGVYNELLMVRGFSAGGLVRGNRIRVVYSSQGCVSPPLESQESHPVLIRDDIMLL